MKTILSQLEPLEDRIAPAMASLHIVNPHTATYTDVDGDHVTLNVTIGTLTAGLFSGMATGGGDQLQLLDLSGGGFEKSDVTFSVVKVAGGNGLANVGYINSTGHNLGTVTVKGDLGQIDAGNNTAGTLALKALSATSMGRLSFDTQAAGSPSLECDIVGSLGTLTVKTDVSATFLNVTGKVTSVTIGGSLIGGAVANSGSLVTTGDIGMVKIGGELLGGSAGDTGAIESGGKITSISVGKSVVGGTVGTSKTAYISSVSDIGSIKIGGDLQGTLGNNSAVITTAGKLTSLTIGRSFRGGGGNQAGYVHADGDVGSIKVGLDVQGGTGPSSAQVDLDGNLTSLTIGGSLIGGIGDDSASIGNEGNMGTVKITGSIVGGPAEDSAQVSCGGVLTSLTIGGSVVGGSNAVANTTVDGTGNIEADTYIGTVKIGGDLVGGNATNGGTLTSSGAIHVIHANNGTGSIGSVSIGGSIIQGFIDNMTSSAGNDSAGIYTQADLGAVTVKHDIIGGFLVAGGKITSVTLGGSLIGQSIVGGVSYHQNGIIECTGNLGPIKIAGDVIGGGADSNTTYTKTGYIGGKHITSIAIGGSLIAGTSSNGSTLSDSGAIRAADDIGSITVGGDIVGNTTQRVNISARGQAVQGATTDVAIGKISVKGGVAYALIQAGYNQSGAAVNADAQIGAVSVGGSWVASSVAAGAIPNMLGYGTGDAAIAGGTPGIFSRIASITITGQLFGTPASLNAGDQFGFVAQQIGSVKVGGNPIAVPANNTPLAVGETTDVHLHIIP